MDGRREIDVAHLAAGLVKHLAERHLDELEVGGDPLVFGLRERRQ